MNELNEDIRRIEDAIHELGCGNTDSPSLHRKIRYSFQRLALIAPDVSLSFAETFEAVAGHCVGSAKRDVALITIRLLSCVNLLPEGSIDKSGRYAVQLVEQGCPDLLSKVLPDKKILTHEKLEIISTIHMLACEHLMQLRQSFSSLQDLNGRRQGILRELNYGPTKSYLNPFGFRSVLSSISSLLSLVADVAQSHGYELQQNLQSLLESVADDLKYYADVPTFLVREYFLPFLEATWAVANALQATLADRFYCWITVPTTSYKLEKKYPLHIVGALIQVFVPLMNKGPGTAQEVFAYCIAENCAVRTEETRLGNIVPGQFVLTLIFDMTEPCESIELDVEIRWNIVGDASVHTREFSIMVEGQRTDLDWEELSLRRPYSLEVVYGDDFYGRKDTLRRILHRLAPNAMQSTYITGQKRVGKSSLAHAVMRNLLDGEHPGEYYVLYLECGEIRHVSGGDTLGELGRRLEEFFSGGLPRSSGWTEKDYSSSIAPLNRLLDQLRNSRPELRFVVILDEFDEINETLYRYGELANTFFLNLRTISSKRNVAFVLVGAERMPHVMAAQGEKLNRFERESLNSFDRETEWADYLDLVRTPVRGILELHETAVFSLFRFTNGHPYFTKMLCATVYECAVAAKDAEVSSNEIEKAARRVIGTLDTNAFAHYWRDGIRGDSREIEIVALKRCRLLLAWARTARSGKPLTCEEIRDNIHSIALNSTEVLPLLEDFCRRGVFREHECTYVATVSLFADWLVESGFSMLVSDQLGDELAEAKQQVEDIAYVRSEEIVNVATTWDLYQGREVTSEQVRAWLGQVESNIDQRLLFKILQNLRFFRDVEVREKFVMAHAWIRGKLPVPVRKSRAQRRDDILVSYTDGLGKSGAHYAALYANTNEIKSDNVVSPEKLVNRLTELDENRLIGLVIVDDMIGTGHNLIDRLKALEEVFREANTGKATPVSVVVLCGTVEGGQRVRQHLADSIANADLEICEVLEDRYFAFGDQIGFWKTQDEKDMAKALLTDLGNRVQKRRPLGYDDQGLLLTFSRNCPNNSLPVLHGSGKAHSPWRPLFPRTKA